jgi:DsrE/DsrF-like family
MKTAIVVLSDPKNGGEEALGRVFNALAVTYDLKQNGDDVTLLFTGAGTRWAGYLSKKDHPAHDLYESVREKVAGISCGCADVFGAAADAEKEGFALIKENMVPGTSGLPSLRKLMSEGYTIVNY